MTTKAEKAQAALERWERTTAAASEAFHKEFDPEHELVIHGRDKTALVMGHPRTGLYWLVPYVLRDNGEVVCGAIDQWQRVVPEFRPRPKPAEEPKTPAARAAASEEDDQNGPPNPYGPGTLRRKKAEPLPKDFNPYDVAVPPRKRGS